MLTKTQCPSRREIRNPEFPLVSCGSDGETKVVKIGDRPFGGQMFSVIAGPCAVESEELIFEAAKMVRSLGAVVLRGGAFKPRTSPYSFQGLGLPGVEIMHQASRQHDIPFVTEVMAPRWVEEMEPLVDAFQVGARNMQNVELLREVGRSDRPVVLKRSFGATVEEWVLAAEYIAQEGNEEIILCERGIRGFGEATRFTLDLAGAMWARHETKLPVIADPSHAIGSPHLIGGAAAATAAAGLDGLMIEVHPQPAQARCDAEQLLEGRDFAALMDRLRPVVAAVGRCLTNSASPARSW